VGYAGYECPGSVALGKVIAREFEKGYKAVIMENHGTVVGGRDMADAYQRFETMEFCARTILFGSQIGKPEYLSDARILEFESLVPPLMPELDPANSPPDESDKRAEICGIVHRACEHGLMISSYGTVSVRTEKNDFLITPTDISRWDLTTGDIVRVENGKREAGKMPSRTAWLHQEIYNSNPGVNSIIMTQPPYLMAFSITNTKFNVRTIPESWIFLQDVSTLNFGCHFLGSDEIPGFLSGNNPAVIIRNDSVIITGDRLLQTFDRLEVAEFSAKSLVMGASLGEMIPINDEQVEKLRDVFL